MFLDSWGYVPHSVRTCFSPWRKHSLPVLFLPLRTYSWLFQDISSSCLNMFLNLSGHVPRPIRIRFASIICSSPFQYTCSSPCGDALLASSGHVPYYRRSCQPVWACSSPCHSTGLSLSGRVPHPARPPTSLSGPLPFRHARRKESAKSSPAWVARGRGGGHW